MRHDRQRVSEPQTGTDTLFYSDKETLSEDGTRQ